MTKELIEAARERAMFGADVDPSDAARLLNELADALEAATRVPVQGEPSDAVKAVIDRDVAIDAIAGGTISIPGGYGVLHGDDAANIVDAIIEHATEPDAAAERVAELEAELASRIEDRDYWYGIADKAKSQRDAANEDRKQAEAEIRDLLRVDIPSLKAGRDAALAAIERVRAVHRETPETGKCEECTVAPYSPHSVRWPCSTIQALDGAPEPEWEYGEIKHEHTVNPCRREETE